VAPWFSGDGQKHCGLGTDPSYFFRHKTDLKARGLFSMKLDHSQPEK